jgi:dephospho-CoA kinase
MIAIGLTGGIGSGKSVVSNMFGAFGAKIIDTDIIAHELFVPGGPCYDILIKHFGKDILLPDETINRSRLREIIFNNLSEKVWLEALLHPLIRKEALRQVENSEAPYCIVVIPLLAETYEEGKYPYLDRIAVVDCEPELQLHRAMQRDAMPETTAQAIIDAQANREQRLNIADDVIYNGHDIAQLRQRVEELHQTYLNLKPKDS